MDVEWLSEWSTGKAEYPPKTLREDVGTLLTELDAARARIAELERVEANAKAYIVACDEDQPRDSGVAVYRAFKELRDVLGLPFPNNSTA